MSRDTLSPLERTERFDPLVPGRRGRDLYWHALVHEYAHGRLRQMRDRLKSATRAHRERASELKARKAQEPETRG